MKIIKIAMIILVLSAVLSGIGFSAEKSETSFLMTVVKITGPLKKEEYYTAKYILIYYEYKWHKDASLFTEEEWNTAVKTAVKKSKAKSLNTIVKIEKGGEKFVKTVIQLMEDSINKFKNYIE